jgi:hypothetical protein
MIPAKFAQIASEIFIDPNAVGSAMGSANITQ